MTDQTPAETGETEDEPTIKPGPVHKSFAANITVREIEGQPDPQTDEITNDILEEALSEMLGQVFLLPVKVKVTRTDD